jgi:predicted MFS family arabinose efflux permease
MRNSGRRERGYLFGWSFGLETLAWAIAAAAGGFVARALQQATGSTLTGFRLTLAGGAACLVAAALPFALVRETRPARSEVRPFRHFLVARDWGLLGRLTAPAFIVAVGAGLVVPFLNLYFRDRFGADVEAIGLYFAASSGLMALGTFAGPWIAARVGLLRTVAWSQLLSIPFMALLALTTSLPVAIGAFLLRSALMNMGHPLARNFAMEAVREDEQAVTNSAESLAWNVAWMFSTVLGGRLIEARGYGSSFALAIGLYLCSTTLYVFFFRHPRWRRIGVDDARLPPAPAG